MKYFHLFVFVLIISVNSYSQQQIFDDLLDPGSISSFASGMQGTASLTPDDAFTYNPAKLTLTEDTKVSFFVSPRYMIGERYPFTNIELYKKTDQKSSFGIGYQNYSYGRIGITSIESPDAVRYVDSYDRAFTVGYARKLNNNLSAGIQLRYAYSYFGEVIASSLLLSLGLLYNPEMCDSKFTFGFSLMNLGSAVKYEYEESSLYSPSPSQMNIGVNYKAADNNYFIIPVDVSVSKPFVEYNSDHSAQSSFKALFDDWENFPNDMTLHTGLSFIWKPLYLGNNISYIQEFYIGNNSPGNKWSNMDYYTHGMNIGLDYKGIQFKAGYAGVFHNADYPVYLRWVFPYETFQFSLTLNRETLSGKKAVDNSSLFEKIIVSGGAGTAVRTGQAKGFSVVGLDVKYSNDAVYNIETAFYFNKRNALVTSLYYNPVPFKIKLLSYTLLESKYETFSFFSLYRYHFLESVEPLYLQGGLGVYRENQTYKESIPKYSYKSILQLAAGYRLNLSDTFAVIPQVEYNNIINAGGTHAPRMVCRSLFNFMIKIGYILN